MYIGSWQEKIEIIRSSGLNLSLYRLVYELLNDHSFATLGVKVARILRAQGIQTVPDFAQRPAAQDFSTSALSCRISQR